LISAEAIQRRKYILTEPEIIVKHLTNFSWKYLSLFTLFFKKNKRSAKHLDSADRKKRIIAL